MINNVTLVGRTTKDFDLRYTPGGTTVGTVTIAVNRTYTNKTSGEREADFIQVVVWGKQAENFANYVKKGHMVGVMGSIQTRNFEGQDGKRIYVTEVVAHNVQFLEQKKEVANKQLAGQSA